MEDQEAWLGNGILRSMVWEWDIEKHEFGMKDRKEQFGNGSMAWEWDIEKHSLGIRALEA